jgi:hypothetical protein
MMWLLQHIRRTALYTILSTVAVVAVAIVIAYWKTRNYA